jgi:bifunctional DNA-binding transcriptional regulator/antitoxin component of YhaV-PrlF toxin-antitoxin module
MSETLSNKNRRLNVKLQKQLSRKVDDKEYPKYVVTIPPKHIAEVGWKEGTELIAVVEEGTIVLRPKK